MGKVNIIKMVVSSQLNYVLMMLPLTIPQLIFSQYDIMVKHFLWNGKRPRIKFNKLCAPRDKGGLGLPDPRLYQISFEMAKLAKHWNNNNAQLDWVTIEKTLSWPYSPIEHLSQCLDTTTNPIMKHSREVWAKIHKMHKLSQCKQPYSSLWYNSVICIGKSPIYWKKWHTNGLCTVTDLFEQGVFMSYNNLVQKYNLKGKDNFWKYLQIRNCVSTKIQHTDGNHILDFLTLPYPQQKASVFYRTTNHVLSNDCIHLKTIWERDIGIVIGDEEWKIILSNTGKYVREARGQFTQYKIIHRFYLTPLRLNRMGLTNNNVCWKCQKDRGTFIHCIWDCPIIQPLWQQTLNI